jgi:hypothetical protein
MNLLHGMSDSLDILAFKWRSIRPKKQRIWIVVAILFGLGVVLGTSFFGAAFRTLLSTPLNGSEQLQQTLLLGINIFLQDNASLAAGGLLWGLLASILLIPLVGYSFTSIVPEGDLASVKITDNHKISDSMFLQFVSSISFVQIITLTGLNSLLTISSDTPGLGIFVGWGLWTVAVLLTVLSAWFFELMVRKYGLKSKIISLAVIIGTVGGLYLLFPNDIAGMFGLGAKYSYLVQNISFNNSGLIILAIIGLIGTIVIISFLISITATKTLQLPERTKKKDRSKVLLARLGLAQKNKISGITQFLANMILRQSNIWKPLLLSTVFSIIMSVVFFAFYQILFTVSTLIPIMISLVWSINIFGILGSGTNWLVSLPQARKKMLGSILTVQYIIIAMITVVVMALLLIFYHPDISIYVNFVLATAACSIVISQFSINKAVKSPYRYRVHIRGESVLPPNKAFSYMAKLFVMGFLISGLMYGLAGMPWEEMTGLPTGLMSGVSQIAALAVIGIIARLRFVSLRSQWLTDTRVLQNIVKTVGTS